MKTIRLLLLLPLLHSACEDNPSTSGHETHFYNYEINITNGRITDYTFFIRDSVFSTTDFIFEDTLITRICKVFWQYNTFDTTYFKISENGYACSSIAKPEHFFLDYNNDTVYDTRLHYTYDSGNRLVSKSCETIHDGWVLINDLVRYSYENGNLVRVEAQEPYVSYPGDYNCYTLYEPSDILNVSDYHNFNNGILGVHSRNLIAHAEYLYGCPCLPSLTPSSKDFEYELDEQGYVIQKKVFTHQCSRNKLSEEAPDEIYTYEYHFHE